MRFRNAAALTLLGWYLMIPPIKNDRTNGGGIYVDSSAPISGWKTESVYDSASECSSANAELFTRYERDHDLSPEYERALAAVDPQRLIKEEKEHAIVSQAYANGQCIATDDPRLKPNQDLPNG